MIDIPERYKEASLEDWNQNSAIRVLLDKYIENFNGYYNSGMAPIMFGSSGSGKTRAAAAMLNVIDQQATIPLSIGWYPVSESFNRMLDYRDMYLSDPYNSIFQGMKKTDVIVLDDFSTLRSSPRLLEYFWIIIESRYSDLKPTIMTANFSVDAGSSEDLWDNMADWFSPAFSRRLQEIGKGLTLVL